MAIRRFRSVWTLRPRNCAPSWTAGQPSRWSRLRQQKKKSLANARVAGRISMRERLISIAKAVRIAASRYGRNRRYYAITDLGRTKLTYYRYEWDDYKEKIDSLLQEKKPVKTQKEENSSEVLEV